jgi:tetratricopeptide (TPR) repeat protein
MQTRLWNIWILVMFGWSCSNTGIEQPSLPLTTLDPDRACLHRLSVSDPNIFNEYSPADDKLQNPEGFDFLAGAEYQDSVEYYNRYAAYHILKGNHSIAASALMRACFLDSTVAYSFYNLSIAELKSQNHLSALSATDIAERLCPNDFYTLANKGFILLELERYAESVEFCTRAFQMDSLNRRNIGNLIHGHYRSGNKELGDHYLQYMEENLLVTEDDQVSFERFKERNNYR